MYLPLKKTHLALAALLFAAAACQETDTGVAPDNTCPADEQYLRAIAGDARDSAYLISKTFYLWDDQLPCFTEFQPKTSANVAGLMAQVRGFSPRNAQGKNLDRFSFAIPIPEWDAMASGREFDFGCGFRFAPNTDDDLRISYVYDRSSAGTQGVQRGWRVLGLNGVPPTRQNVDAVEAELAKNSVQVLFGKPDGTQQTLTLTAQEYAANFILLKKVIAAGDRKVGYLVFNSFLGDNTDAELKAAFNEFKAAGVNEMVMDLRYNGGGYVSYQELLANLLAPPAAKGKVMTKRVYNKLLTGLFEQRNINLTTNFDNQPSLLNLSRVVFITSPSTASASELLINSLQPHMTVKIVGRPSYGKPVGFRSIPIVVDKANPAANFYVFPVEFQSVNAAGFGDYFDGLPVDANVPDDVTRNFGDPQEGNLKTALAYLQSGVLSGGRVSTEDRADAANSLLDHAFKGAVIAEKAPL